MNKLKTLLKKKFVKNVMLVSSGTAAAQLITLGFSLVITRIYGPESYGILGVFIAVVNIVAPVAALTYPISIVLPKEDKKAVILARLAAIVTLIMALVTLLVILLFKENIISIFQINPIGELLLLIPIVILFSGLLQIMEQWLIRKKLFKITAKVAFWQALIINSAKVGGGLITPIGLILVLITAASNGLKAMMLFLGAAKKNEIKINNIFKKKIEFIELKKAMHEYRDFPMYRAPQVFISAVSQSLPVMILATFFGPSAAGFYSIARTGLGLPSQLIGKAVGDVFYPRISEADKNGENLAKLITKATTALFLVGLIPFGVVILFGPFLFGLVFGADWITAGEYARWMALWLFLMFMNSPSIMAIPVLKLQKKFLLYEFVSILFKILAMIAGYYFFESDIAVVALYSIAGVVTYIYLIIWVIVASRKNEA